jgi:hypothetical protein
VRCYNNAGALADSRYTVSVVLNDVFSPINTVAYAWANNATSASYTPSAIYSYNASGGAITATRAAAGTYQIQFAGLNLGNGHVKVTAYGSAMRCNVGSWSGTNINIRCYDSTGALADSRYVVAFSR